MVVHRLTDDGSVVAPVLAPAPTVLARGPAEQLYPIIPGEYSLGVYRGDTFEWVFRLLAADNQPVDILGWRFKAEIRTAVNGELMAGLQRMASVSPDVDPSTQEGRAAIRIEMQQGLVRMRLSSSSSREITGPGWWDLEATTPDGWVKTVLRGPVEYLGDVTTGDVQHVDGRVW